MHAELYQADKSSVEIRLSITPELLQQHGFVHGGVLSYLADTAITFAGGIALGGDALTSEFKINYIKPAKGNYLSAQAKVISAGKRQSVCQCEITAVEEESRLLCAIAQGTVVKLSK
ncbi:PaaI family thioesterase [Microbulbifer sp. 2201CG32-9]|uniref:PaaI family thioesterase n=1 Tax=Microbulbifer sp. 2201CG32-9 TaxID=3232309 RepID=UPI00345BB13B